MRMMDAEATERFNQILKEWRKEGRGIGWPELNQAARIAQAEPEEREQEEKRNGNHRTQ